MGVGSENRNLLAAPAHHDRARLAALSRYEILDTPAEEAFDRITQLASTLFNVPIVLISLVDKNRQWCKSCYGLHTRETLVEHFSSEQIFDLLEVGSGLGTPPLVAAELTHRGGG